MDHERPVIGACLLWLVFAGCISGALRLNFLQFTALAYFGLFLVVVPLIWLTRDKDQ